MTGTTQRNFTTLDERLLATLRCPVSGERLQQQGSQLVSESGRYQYPITDSGITLFAGDYCSPEAQRQQTHYDHISGQYVENLTYSHTQEYWAYLDKALLDHTADAVLESVAEICCGYGEAFLLMKERIQFGVGVDISLAMLEIAHERVMDDKINFVQGDATILPIDSEQFDSVFMLGGVHHVNNRERLFAEIFRILKPGGRFIWREPADDFFLWRGLRAIIYRISPALDAQTEQPLRYQQSRFALTEAGFDLKSWQTYGFLGFTLFMNSDVLVLNRLFRFIPGINRLVRFMTKVDDWTLRLPGMKRRGLQVVGVAEKPA